ncbi:MAG: glycosyltransferase family 2 protein [Oscillospiraceae bacterium]
MSKISVIVPVYNAKNTIDICVNSIVSQSYKDIEVLLIDDGSTDGSGKICDSWAEKDSRIKVVHQQNNGVSSARNAGLKYCNGDYILFVDADDTIPDNALQHFSDYFGSNSDLIIGSYNEVRNNKYKKIIKKSREYDQNKIQQNINEFDKSINTLWAKLYKSEIIHQNHIEFNIDLPLGEDHIFNLEYCKYVNKCLVIGDIVYNYTLGGFASSLKYYENINILNMTLLKSYDNFCKNKSEVCNFYKRKIRAQFIGSLVHYISYCSYSTAKRKVQETFDIYNEYLTDKWIDSQYYSEYEIKAILNKQYKRLMYYLYRKNFLKLILKK